MWKARAACLVCRSKHASCSDLHEDDPVLGAFGHFLTLHKPETCVGNLQNDLDYICSIVSQWECANHMNSISEILLLLPDQDKFKK